MTPYRFAILASVLFTLGPAGAQAAGDPAACHERGAALSADQVQLKAQAEERKTLLETTEKAGDIWEEAETMRHFGEAEKADIAQMEYHKFKSELLVLDRNLQDGLRRLNAGVAEYNEMCVPARS